MGSLFYSPTTQKILAILCENPQASFHVNELIRLTGRYPNSVTYALRGLEKTNLVTFRRKGRRKLYKVNTANPIYPEVKNIFTKLGAFIDEKLTPLEKIAEISWVKILNRPSSLPLSFAAQTANQKKVGEVTGASFRYSWQNGITGGIYYVQRELEAVTRALKTKIEKSPAWAATVIKKFGQSCQELERQAKKASEGRLYQESNEKLAGRLKKFYQAYLDQMGFMSLPGMIENWLLEEIKEEIKKALKKQKKAKELDHYTKILTAPTLIIKEQLEALKIAGYVKEKGLNKNASRMITDHTNKWAHVPLSNFADSPFSYDHFETEVEMLATRFPNPPKEIEKKKKAERKRQEEIKKAMKELNFSKAARLRVKLYQDISFLRSARWNFIHKAHLFHLPLIDEVARRMGLARQDLAYLSYEEMIEFLTTSKKPAKGLITKRKRGWAVLLWEGELKIINGIREIVEAMERFRIVDQSREPLKPEEEAAIDFKDTYQLQGIPVFKGEISAPVKVVLNRKDFKKVKEGDIIVAYQTTPQYLSCLYRAAGLIIDEANPTSHAVLYAKALKLPTVIGTKFGTRVFEDNDQVLLNATKGTAKKVNNPGLEEFNFAQKAAFLKN